jgi:hypothetical protein
VVAGTEPELDGSDAVRAWLTERYPPRPEPREWACDAHDVIQVGVEFCESRAAKARADGDMRRLGSMLIRAMGEHDADTITCEHWRASWRADKNGKCTLRVRDMRGLDVGAAEEVEP